MPIQPNQAAGYSNLSVTASYAYSPSYAGDPGTYGPNVSANSQPMAQQQFMMSIYMTMMQSQMQLQQGFSQFLGQGYGQIAPPSYGAPQQPSYGAPAPSYGGGGGGYGGGGGGGYAAPKPAPVKVAPAPKPPAKKGGYA